MLRPVCILGGLVFSPLILTACRSETPAPAFLPPTLEVAYGGCKLVDAGRVCYLPEKTTLTLWVRSEADATIVVEPNSTQDPDAQTLHGGHRFVVRPTPATKTVTVNARRNGVTQSWSLPLAPFVLPAWWDNAVASADAQQCERAAQIVSTATASEPDNMYAGLGLGLVATCAYRRGDRTVAATYYRRSIEAHRRAKSLSEVARHSASLAQLLMRDGYQFAAARAVLEQAPYRFGGPAESEYFIDYAQGVLALNSGDLRQSLIALARAARQAQRVGSIRQRVSAEQMLAMQLRRSGRRAEAEQLLARWSPVPDALGACEQGQFYINQAWNRLLAREAGEPAVSPVAELARAVDIFSSTCAQWRESLANAQINLALAHLHDAQVHAASEMLARSEQGPRLPAQLELWRLDIAGRIARAQDQPQRALALFDELTVKADATLSPSGRWRAALGRALTLLDLDRREQALQAFAQAQEQAETDSLQVPIHGGRDVFLAQREWVTQRHLQILLELDRLPDAAALIRRARARTLRSIAMDGALANLTPRQRAEMDGALTAFAVRREAVMREVADDWMRRDDVTAWHMAKRAEEREALQALLDSAYRSVTLRHVDLAHARAPRDGELLLMFHPLPDGWVGIAQHADEIVSHHLDCVATDQMDTRLGECLLGPFSEQIQAAREVQLMPSGTLRNVDLHALEVAGKALIDWRPTVYSLDLIAVPDKPSEMPERALLVGDPHGNLPAARREVAAVATTLSERRIGIQHLSGLDAIASRTLQELTRVDLLHYAGHAQFAGDRGWDSALQLADNSEIHVGDVLALRRAPRWVVLSGCNTGRAAPGVAESLGLAQAFLISGSRAVLATVRPVSDTTAQAMTQAFYAAWLTHETIETAFQRAVHDLKRASPDADWQSFRLLVR